jgi:TonB family protein
MKYHATILFSIILFSATSSISQTLKSKDDSAKYHIGVPVPLPELVDSNEFNYSPNHIRLPQLSHWRDSIEISFERICTGLGMIAEYRINIYGNGLVVYNEKKGKVFVEKNRSYIPMSTLVSLVHEFLQIGFFSFKKSYYEMATDLHSTVTSVRIGKRKKSVLNYGTKCAPPILKIMESKIDSIGNIKNRAIDDSLQAEIPPPNFVHTDQSAVLIQKIMPIYPQAELQNKIEGHVFAKVWVTKNGAIKQTIIIKSQGRNFEKATIEAIKQWRFKPALVNDKPVDIWIVVGFYFRLSGIEMTSSL